jgi:hypothetical protein
MNTGRVVFIVFERIIDFNDKNSNIVFHVYDSEEAALESVKNYICPYIGMKEIRPPEGYERYFVYDEDRYHSAVGLYILQREVES